MKLCQDCRRTPLPYAIAAVIAAFISFLTWFMLAFAGVSPDVNRWWTLGSFVAVYALLIAYMLSCMRRHCGHDHHAHG